jgi:hypothetical protein
LTEEVYSQPNIGVMNKSENAKSDLHAMIYADLLARSDEENPVSFLLPGIFIFFPLSKNQELRLSFKSYLNSGTVTGPKC